MICRQTRIVHAPFPHHCEHRQCHKTMLISSCCGKQGLSPIERKTTSLKIKSIGQIIQTTIIIFSYMYVVPVGQEKVVFIMYVQMQLEGPTILYVCLDVGQSSKSVIKSTYLPLNILTMIKLGLDTRCGSSLLV